MVANGDTANKVGTYQLAIAAKYHGIPFYVAAPSSSCDLSVETGQQIVIEERPSQELTDVNGIRIAAPGKPSLSGIPESGHLQLGTHPLHRSKRHLGCHQPSRAQATSNSTQC